MTPRRSWLLLLVPPLLALLVGGSAPLRAAPSHLVLVELFTSQGCSSCPPADAFMLALPGLGFGRDRVVPLTFHVDYWDDLGWKDPFASPAFTERQRAYARSGLLSSPAGEDGIHGVYTPQMVVGGRVHLSGGRRDAALEEIQRAASGPEPAALVATAVLDGPREQALVTARVTAAPRPPAAHEWRLFVALAQKQARTAVAHGENAGDTLLEAAVARWLSPPLPVSTDGGPVQVAVPRPRDVPWGELELVVFVQSQSTGQVVGVRSVALPAAA